MVRFSLRVTQLIIYSLQMKSIRLFFWIFLAAICLIVAQANDDYYFYDNQDEGQHRKIQKRDIGDFNYYEDGEDTKPNFAKRNAEEDEDYY